MSRRRPHRLDLRDLPPAASAALEAALTGEEVTVSRDGEQLGTVTCRLAVLAGQVVAAAPPGEAPSPREDVAIVATAMELSERAHRQLSERFGEGYLVLDLHEAPPTTDILLVPPISPQLIASLRTQFPAARLLVTEIEDEELGVHYAGPVARMLEAGASAYLPPRPVTEIAGAVHAHLVRRERLALEASDEEERRQLPG